MNMLAANANNNTAVTTPDGGLVIDNNLFYQNSHMKFIHTDNIGPIQSINYTV